MSKSLALLALVALAACGSSDATTSPPNSITSNAIACAGGTVSLPSAQATRVDCSNGGTSVTLAAGGASYLIVPQLAVSLVPNTFVSYQLQAGTGVAAELAPNASNVSSLAPTQMLHRTNRLQMAFDASLRTRARKAVVKGAWAARTTRTSAFALAAVAPPAAGSLRAFRVLSDTTGVHFATVTARLAFAGSNILLYVDTLAPANGFTASQLTTFGTLFDQTLYPIDTAAFGAPSDIDQNGRVIMLMTPRVNALTSTSECNSDGFIEGFFNEEDLGAPANDPNSNQGEIFYSIVPDPSGISSCTHTVADVGFDVPATFLHELQHLINFSQHVVVHHSNPEEGWLDEGLSIHAEELGSLYYEQKCPGTACRSTPSQLFPDSSQGFVSGFLFDSYLYALRPDTASVTLHSDSDDGFSWRGGDWLLARWMDDQYGAGVLHRLEQTAATGVANIQAATGRDFPSMFADFGLSIYTDSIPGFPRTTAPAADRFVTRNVRQLWARVFATSGGSPDFPTPSPLPVQTLGATAVNARMYPGTSAYYRLNTSAGAATVSVTFSSATGQPLSAAYHPQLAIFRLPPGG